MGKMFSEKGEIDCDSLKGKKKKKVEIKLGILKLQTDSLSVLSQWCTISEYMDVY